MQVQANGSQYLANLVVQFARDVLAFSFLGFEQTARICLQCLLCPFALGDVPRRTLNSDRNSVLVDHSTAYFYRLARAILANDLSLVGSFDRSVQLDAKTLTSV